MLNLKMIVTLLIAAGHCLIAPRLDAADAALKKLRIGYPSHSASMYPIYVTKEAKLLEKHGLDGESDLRSRGADGASPCCRAIGCDDDIRLGYLAIVGFGSGSDIAGKFY